MTDKPLTAFILAAGKGTRLRPYTDKMPKPMVSIWGKPILHHTLDKCKKHGIANIIINLHYLGHVIHDYFASEKNIYFSEETTLLDTGGGVKFAHNKINSNSFFLINGDAFWTEGKDKSAFENLENAWNPKDMDILLLLQPISKMVHTQGIGDYDLDENGRAIRSHNKMGNYMFAGIRISKKTVIDSIDEDIFSFLKCMDAAEKKGTLFGIIHEGAWHHISTPKDLETINALPSEVDTAQ